MPLFSLEQDPVKAVEGVPIELPQYDNRLTIARAGGHNADLYEKALSEVTEPYRRAIAQGLLDPATDRLLMMQAHAMAVVKKWETRFKSLPKAVQDAFQGEPTADGYVVGIDWRGEELRPDTVENRVAVFKALPDLFLDVRTLAKDMRVFALGGLEQAAKN